jgi:hypothetical protein
VTDGAGAAVDHHRFCVRFFTSSSLTGCNMILFGCPGVLPEWPFDQSYDIAYAKIVPLRLNADEEIGPGHGSNAIMFCRKRERKVLRKVDYFSIVCVSPCPKS